LPEGKNLVGAFYQPTMVLADVSFLLTLTEREYACGMAEIIKMAALQSDEAFTELEHNTAALRKREPGTIVSTLVKAVSFKAGIVSADVTDRSGIRAMLNLGHTLAHALETDAEYEDYSHGEAVAAGLVFAAKLSCELGYGDESMITRLISIIDQFGLPVRAKIKSVAGIMAIIEQDKKRDERGAMFVLLDGFGNPKVDPVDPETVKRVLKEANK
jgi:3-dehydroquinate synthase